MAETPTPEQKAVAELEERQARTAQIHQEIEQIDAEEEQARRAGRGGP
jgi:hypothetical protein